MKKQLTFNSFYNDFNVSNINCVDVSLATCIGQQNPDFYYQYCFIYGIINNWCFEDDKSETILNEIGFEPIGIEYSTNTELRDEIIKLIDENKIVFISVKYRSLFYYKSYMDKSDRGQTILPICGYDSDRDTFIVMDMTLPRKTLYSMITGEVYCPLQIKAEMLNEIVHLSKVGFNDDNSNYPLNNKAFYLKQHNTKNVDFIHLINKLKDAINKKEDYLIYLLKNLKEKMVSPDFLIKKCLNSYWILIDILLRFFKIKNKSCETKELELLEDCYKTRKKFVYLSIRMLLRQKVNMEAINSIITEIYNNNIQLNNIIDNLLMQINSSNLNHFTLVSQDAKVSADSELRTCEFVCNNSIFNDTNYWVSVKAGNDHWIKIDLLNSFEIQKIEIEHFGKRDFNTKTFEIFGSQDDRNWDKLLRQEDNIKDITELDNVGLYRYIKMHIIETNWVDRYARIRRISIYA